MSQGGVLPAQVTHSTDMVARPEKFQRLTLSPEEFQETLCLSGPMRQHLSLPYESWRHPLPESLDVRPLTTKTQPGGARLWKAAGPEGGTAGE